MYVDAFLHHLLTSPEYKQKIVHIQPIPPRDSTIGELDEPFHPVLQSRLEFSGISSLYTHQARAVNAARHGNNVMVATASASGKTLCYNLVVLEAILKDPSSRALYLFPTKALAQDQLRSLNELACPELIFSGGCATFDGDTPQSERAEIKRKAKVVLTNPDMLYG